MQFFNVNNTSLVQDAGAKPVEEYIPLWFSNGTTVNNQTVGLGTACILDGTNGSTNVPSTINARLLTLSSQWTTNTKFALEVTMRTNNGAGVASAQLYDITGSVLAGSSVSTTSVSSIVVRSAQFTLVPGRSYAVTIATNNTSYVTALTDASLIAFP